MNDVETRGDILQLNHRKMRVGPKTGEEVVGDWGLPCASHEGIVNARTGHSYRSDVTLWRSQFDVGKMDLRWVDHTSDPLFAGLSPYERKVLYLRFAGGRTCKANCQDHPQNWISA